ncbi:MAG: hypothetical protein CL693_04010 [Cellvibrionaceae bacterium]|nr:hypothetical protein [Cellvibrionaceae bacterium]
MNTRIFVNRRKGAERRHNIDNSKDLPLDLYNRKRRKTNDRRSVRTLAQDYYAVIGGRTLARRTRREKVSETEIPK